MSAQSVQSANSSRLERRAPSAVVLGVLGLVPIVGFFATVLSAIWVVIISLMLFARSEPHRSPGA